MNIDVNYKNKRRYNTAKYPIRQPLFFVGLIWLLSKIALIGKRYKVEKINMEGLKPPYKAVGNGGDLKFAQSFGRKQCAKYAVIPLEKLGEYNLARGLYHEGSEVGNHESAVVLQVFVYYVTYGHIRKS